MSKVEISEKQLENIFLQCLQKKTFEAEGALKKLFMQIIEEKQPVLSTDIQSSVITPELKFTETIYILNLSIEMYNYLRKNKIPLVSRQKKINFRQYLFGCIHQQFQALRTFSVTKLFDQVQASDIKVIICAERSFFNLSFSHMPKKKSWYFIETCYEFSEKYLTLFKDSDTIKKERIKILISGLEMELEGLDQRLGNCDMALYMILSLAGLSSETKLLPLLSKNLNLLYQSVPSLKLYCRPCELQQLKNLLERIDREIKLTQPLTMLHWEIKENITSQPIVTVEYAQIIDSLLILLDTLNSFSEMQISALPSTEYYNSLKKIEEKWKELLQEKKLGNLAISRNTPLKYLEKLFLLFCQMTEESSGKNLVEIEIYLNLLLIQARILQQITFAPDQAAALILAPYTKISELFIENAWWQKDFSLYNDLVDVFMLFSYLKVDNSTPCIIFKDTFVAMLDSSDCIRNYFDSSMIILDTRRLIIVLMVLRILPAYLHKEMNEDNYEDMLGSYNMICEKTHEIDLLQLHPHLDLLEQAVPFSNFCDKTFNNRFKNVIVRHLDSFGKKITIINDLSKQKLHILAKIDLLLKQDIRSENIKKALGRLLNVVSSVKSPLDEEIKLSKKQKKISFDSLTTTKIETKVKEKVTVPTSKNNKKKKKHPKKIKNKTKKNIAKPSSEISSLKTSVQSSRAMDTKEKEIKPEEKMGEKRALMAIPATSLRTRASPPSSSTRASPPSSLRTRARARARVKQSSPIVLQGHGTGLLRVRCAHARNDVTCCAHACDDVTCCAHARNDAVAGIAVKVEKSEGEIVDSSAALLLLQELLSDKPVTSQSLDTDLDVSITESSISCEGDCASRSSASSEIVETDEEKMEQKSAVEWCELSDYYPEIDDVFPKKVQQFISELHCFCIENDIKPAVCKGGVVRTILSQHYNGYRLKPSDYDFEIQSPEDPLKQSHLLHFIKKYIGANPDKRRSLYKLCLQDTQTRTFYPVDIDIVTRTFSLATDFLINSLRLVPECDDQGNILQLKIFFNTQYFDNEFALKRHITEANLDTPGVPEDCFAKNYLSLLRAVRFHVHDGLSMVKIQAAMVAQGHVLQAGEIKNFHRMYKTQQSISNDLRKLTHFSQPQVLKVLEIYQQLGWLKYCFAKLRSEETAIKQTLLAALSVHTPLHLLYELNFIGCWFNINQQGKWVRIDRDQDFKSHLFHILRLFKLSYEYNLHLPADFKKYVKNCRSHSLEIVTSPGAWSLIEDDLNFLLLRGHGFGNFMKLFEYGFFGHIFPGAAIQLATNPFYLKFLRFSFAETELKEHGLSYILANLLIGELLASDVSADNLKLYVQSATSEDHPWMSKFLHAHFFSKMDKLQLSRMISSLEEIQQNTHSSVVESSFNIFSMPECLPPLVPFSTEEVYPTVDDKDIPKIIPSTSVHNERRSSSRKIPGVHFQFNSHMLSSPHQDQSRELKVRNQYAATRSPL